MQAFVILLWLREACLDRKLSELDLDGARLPGSSCPGIVIAKQGER
jgi:hypothetical protein